ncbi:hypothetical protein FQR65_LT18948 [Abscondita terminalis]|nr:hypothetical protein FQR65_LT18948 [Abscondita terminalis]
MFSGYLTGMLLILCLRVPAILSCDGLPRGARWGDSLANCAHTCHPDACWRSENFELYQQEILLGSSSKEAQILSLLPNLQQNAIFGGEEEALEKV